jgi:ATP-dependent helicase/nuclease subunit A
MYVGLTRARDYLVFPSREKPPIWLNRVCNNGQEEQPALNTNSNESYWEWEGKTLMMTTEVMYFPNDFQHTLLQEAASLQLTERHGRAAFPPMDANMTEDTTLGNNIEVVSQVSVFSPFSLPEVPERQQVAAAIKQLLLAQWQFQSASHAAEIAEQICNRFELQDLVDSTVLLEKSQHFMSWVETQFEPSKVSICYPVKRSLESGQLFESSIDIHLETPAGSAMISLAKFIGDSKGRMRYLRSQDDSLRLTKQALQGNSGQQSVGVWVFFVLYGEALELKV